MIVIVSNHPCHLAIELLCLFLRGHQIISAGRVWQLRESLVHPSAENRAFRKLPATVLTCRYELLIVVTNCECK